MPRNCKYINEAVGKKKPSYFCVPMYKSFRCWTRNMAAPIWGQKTREDFLYLSFLSWPTWLNKEWVTGRFSETCGCHGGSSSLTAPPRVTLCAAGFHRPSSSWPHTEGALQLTRGFAPCCIRPQTFQALIQAIWLRAESRSQLRSKRATVTVLS